MLEVLYTGAKTIGLSKLLARGTFMSSWDAVLYRYSSTGSYDTAKIFKDGTNFPIAKLGSGYTIISAQDGRGAAYYGQSGRTDIALLDEISGMPRVWRPVNNVSMYGKVSGGSMVDHVNKLLYTPASGSKINVYSLMSGDLVKTVSVSGISFGTGDSLQDAGAAQLFVLNKCAGRIALIDRVSGSVDFLGAVPNNTVVTVFDTVHRVVIAVLDNMRTAVYALRNVAATLADPTLNPAPAMHTLSKVTTRLADEMGNGIAGKALRWWLSNGRGWLERTVTVTDANGYAYNWYYGPTDSSGLGDETINVEVTI